MWLCAGSRNSSTTTTYYTPTQYNTVLCNVERLGTHYGGMASSNRLVGTTRGGSLDLHTVMRKRRGEIRAAEYVLTARWSMGLRTDKGNYQLIKSE